jgi:hypothetical protein
MMRNVSTMAPVYIMYLERKGVGVLFVTLYLTGRESQFLNWRMIPSRI